MMARFLGHNQARITEWLGSDGAATALAAAAMPAAAWRCTVCSTTSAGMVETACSACTAPRPAPAAPESASPATPASLLLRLAAVVAAVQATDMCDTNLTMLDAVADDARAVLSAYNRHARLATRPAEKAAWPRTSLQRLQAEHRSGLLPAQTPCEYVWPGSRGP